MYLAVKSDMSLKGLREPEYNAAAIIILGKYEACPCGVVNNRKLGMVDLRGDVAL